MDSMIDTHERDPQLAMPDYPIILYTVYMAGHAVLNIIATYEIINWHHFNLKFAKPPN